MATIQVRTDELDANFERYSRSLVRYGDDNNPQWGRLIDVRPSEHQGWDIILDGCTLQSCFPDTPITLREQLFDCDADWVRANVGLD